MPKHVDLNFLLSTHDAHSVLESQTPRMGIQSVNHSDFK